MVGERKGQDRPAWAALTALLVLGALPGAVMLFTAAAPVDPNDMPDPLREWLESVSVYQAIVWLAGIAFALWFVWKKGWRLFVRGAKSVVRVAELAEKFSGLPEFMAEQRTVNKRHDEYHERLSRTVDEVLKETRPNSGSTLRDDLSTTNATTKLLAHRMARIETALGLDPSADMEEDT
ncbi:hypothetical protein IT882_13160 [Microbacterium schleiferi]|uniref:Uncharacterized protein n=1 Tax=Microbacterium schleiferi TaxID=69362 RepID=A0A7S8MXD3_9MICO|nr:hypothetical protein [Microbacterium schleiferi]QPE04140.1 hypothetical protein IT882_13160 [Microbacterium schleiferi]